MMDSSQSASMAGNTAFFGAQQQVEGAGDVMQDASGPNEFHTSAFHSYKNSAAIPVQQQQQFLAQSQQQAQMMGTASAGGDKNTQQQAGAAQQQLLNQQQRNTASGGSVISKVTTQLVNTYQVREEEKDVLAFTHTRAFLQPHILIRHTCAHTHVNIHTRAPTPTQTTNQEFQYTQQANPKRALTKPSEGVKNDGHDNEHSDLVLYMSDTLVHNNPSSGTVRTYTIQEMLGQVRGLAVAVACVHSLRAFACIAVCGMKERHMHTQMHMHFTNRAPSAKW